MPKYFCDYCDTYLTHDSPSVRKTHCAGRKHRENVKFYYEKWYEQNMSKLQPRGPPVPAPNTFAPLDFPPPPMSRLLQNGPPPPMPSLANVMLPPPGMLPHHRLTMPNVMIPPPTNLMQPPPTGFMQPPPSNLLQPPPTMLPPGVPSMLPPPNLNRNQN